MTTLVPGAPPWEDLDAFFQEFAAVVSTAAGSRFMGIFQAESAIGGELGGPALLVKERDVDVLSIARGDTLTVDGIDRIVAGIQPDGTGIIALVLDLE